MSIFFAILSVLVGIALLFGGYRLARFIIPLWGFVAGLSIGGAVAADLSGEVFLGTFIGITTGIVLGLAFALLAYLYYYVAVILLFAGFGYWAGSGFVQLLGFSPGVLSVVVGIAVAMLIAVIALAINSPKYVLIFITSLTGAVATIGGVMLLFNQIPLDIYGYRAVEVAISNSFWWSLSAIALFSFGLVTQAMLTNDWDDFEQWSAGEHTPHDAAPPTAVHHAS